MSIIISSLDTSQVLEAVETLMKASAALAAMEGRIMVSDEVNVDPDKAPWAGIYSLGDQYPIRTLGMGNGFRQQRVAIAVIVQNASRTSGKECRKVLGQFQKAVVDCILSDTSLGGTMDVVDEFNVTYAAPAKQGSNASFQSAIITFTAVKLVGVSGG